MARHPYAYVFVTAAALAGSAAHAQVTAIEGGSPSDIKLSIAVRASVMSRCAFTTGSGPSGTGNLGDVTQPFTADFPFKISCNGPARVGLVSDNGGLRSAAAAPTGYANLAPYDVQLTLAGDAGAAATAACEAKALAAGAGAPCTFRGPSSATSGLLLPGMSTDAPGSLIRLRTPTTPAAGILVGGSDYSDRLTVTISPAN